MNPKRAPKWRPKSSQKRKMTPWGRLQCPLVRFGFKQVSQRGVHPPKITKIKKMYWGIASETLNNGIHVAH